MTLNSKMRNGQNDEDYKRSSSYKKRDLAKKISIKNESPHSERVEMKRFKGVLADKKTALGSLQRSSVHKS